MNEKQFNNKVTKIARLMSLESKVNIVGSAKWNEVYSTVTTIVSAQ